MSAFMILKVSHRDSHRYKFFLLFLNYGHQRINSSGVPRATALTGFVFLYQNAIKIPIPSYLCIKFVKRSHFLAINS